MAIPGGHIHTPYNRFTQDYNNRFNLYLKLIPRNEKAIHTSYNNTENNNII